MDIVRRESLLIYVQIRYLPLIFSPSFLSTVLFFTVLTPFSRSILGGFQISHSYIVKKISPFSSIPSYLLFSEDHPTSSGIRARLDDWNISESMVDNHFTWQEWKATTKSIADLTNSMREGFQEVYDHSHWAVNSHWSPTTVRKIEGTSILLPHTVLEPPVGV